MGINASIFAARSDEEAASGLQRSDGFVCDVSPVELWELEGILTSVPALEVPAASHQPVAASDGYESFVIAVGLDLGAALAEAGATGRLEAAHRWKAESAELANWPTEQVQRLVEELTETLTSIAAEGRAPYLRVSV